MADDIEYLQKKGALTIPDAGLRNELLRSYAQYVHPYMPLLDLKDFLTPVEKNDGSSVVSLLLFHAVMFAGTAYIDMRFLQAQGFETRKAARKVFFQRARLLYDFDYEIDRITLVQALLLMTYWYETPDDQKDTWHWMGVSISLAQTIGLHRDPAKSSMDIKRQRLWKRIWWSCFMRDRLIALGMRRPTRIKHEDCDVPMLTEDDFETEGLPAELVRMLGGCPAVRDSAKRVTLAHLCIETAKLCLCISHVLSAQYSVLSHKFGSTVETTMMLVPKKAAAETCEVMQCNAELEKWYDQLDPALRYFVPGTKERTNTNDGEVINLHRALLNMVHLTTSSALHRPQVIPSAPNLSFAADLQELSRKKVREAATEITEIARDLYTSDLVRYLPTTGVTVLLPAVIIHLLDIKSADPVVRNTSLRRFYQCMQVLQRLREMYASADFAFSFLEAAVRKANIEMPPDTPTAAVPKSSSKKTSLLPSTTTPLSNPTRYFPIENSVQHSLTPPPDVSSSTVAKPAYFLANSTLALSEMNLFPPQHGYDHTLSPPHSHSHSDIDLDLDLINSSGEQVDGIMSKSDFDALINFDGGADLFAAEDGLGLDMGTDWMAGLTNGQQEGVQADYEMDEHTHEGIAITGDLEDDLRTDDDNITITVA
jgi:Fungal specific transcription factor domain